MKCALNSAVRVFYRAFLTVALVYTPLCLADDFSWQQDPAGQSQMLHGGVGLLQTPTARMADEGDFSINYFDNQQYRYWSVSLQLFPWLESTVRYTDVRTRLYSPDPNFSGDQTLKDKGIDVKFRLLEESYYLPQISLALRDFGGTGFFNSEFLGASKRFGPLDVHLGMGWGYLGTAGSITNPFCELKDSFCDRVTAYSGRGGKIDYQRFFKGPASLIGDLEYQTPWQPLRLKLEYEGNNYLNDRAGALKQDSRWNIGAVYQLGNFDLNLSYQRGNTFAFGVSYKFNMHTLRQIKVDEPPRALTRLSNEFGIDDIDRAKLASDLYYKAGYVLATSELQKDKITIYGNQIAYRDNDEAIERVGRILASELPESVKTYRIVENAGVLPMVETVVDAPRFIDAAQYNSLQPDITSSYFRQDIQENTLDAYKPKHSSGFFSGIEAFWIQTFGSPEAFYLYQGGVNLNGGYRFNATTSLAGSIKVNLFENFEKFKFNVDNQDTRLPRVRTFVREYVSGNRVSMGTLFAHWQDRLAPNLYGQVYGGYLETMFGGLGGEFLYRQVDSNLAYGFDINYVKQRSFENDFDFLDYKTLTGHANIYWQPEFLAETLVTIKVGQYLAKDKGVTFDFAKRFDSGIVVGAYAAFTNVSSDDYGEGSFTKGFYLSIPFDLFSLRPAKGRGYLPWIPISRDGGQALNRPVLLYSTTEARSPFYR